MIEVITGFHPAGFEEYGKRFMKTFEQYWSSDFQLKPYIEESIKFKDQRWLTDIQDWNLFFKKYADDPESNGLVPQPCWKEKDYSGSIDSKSNGEGYSYRTDAVKFARIPFIIHDAALNCLSRYMIWIDGDTYAFGTITEKWIKGLLPEGKAVAFLGRGSAHSECGFLLFDLNIAMPIIEMWTEIYTSGDFKEYREWHDSFLFDVSIARCDNRGIPPHDMTPGGKGHVWFQSPLGEKLDHIKGFKRKELGYSPERYGRGREAIRNRV